MSKYGTVAVPIPYEEWSLPVGLLRIFSRCDACPSSRSLPRWHSSS